MTIDSETPEEYLEAEGEDGEAPSDESQEERVYRIGGISYLHIPTKNAFESGNFYETVFGWKLHGDPAWPLFEDATGHVIGRWVTDLDVAPESTGVRPFVHVESIDEILDVAVANGGEVDRIPFQEGDIWVATFRDPSGTVIGLWQTGSRRA
jgi:predicted enzyme related to lactoylglutathione lyase